MSTLEIALAVLLADAIATTPGLFDRLLWESPVVIVTAPDGEAEGVATLLKACFSAGRPPLVPPAERARARRNGIDPSAKLSARIAKAFGERPPSSSMDLELIARTSVRNPTTLFGVCRPGTETWLPELLRRLCEHRLTLGAFDPLALAVAVEAATGCRLEKLPSAEFAARVRPDDFDLAVHPSRGAEGSLARLEAILKPRRSDVSGPRLSELPGYGAAGEWGVQLAKDLRAYRDGALPWRDLDPAALLFGPAGTGKSLFARSLAREAELPFLSGSLAQWQSVGEAHLGTTLKAMREFFAAARRLAPAVALVDELDSFGDRATFLEHHKSYSIQIVNGLLECLDSGSGHEGIVLIGTTNYPSSIDPAILRSGRFDRQIEIGLPDPEGLAGILRHHLGSDLAGADLGEASRRAVGATGADCAAWVRRARATARRAGRAIDFADLLEQIGSGTEASVEFDRRIALHEAGHAVASYVLGYPVREVRLGSNAATGLGKTEISLATRHSTRPVLEDLLVCKLAGRCAEILCLGEASAGSVTDLADATRIAWNMNFEFGLGARLASADLLPPDPYERNVVEVALSRASEKATAVLQDRRDQLEAIADHLLRRRWLSFAEIEQVLDGVSAPGPGGMSETERESAESRPIPVPTISNRLQSEGVDDMP
ncbi:AAA family ATPase [Methylobacterium brachythecii]|uniref:AAA+ ATPase domain-containing protein n=1 Tax=Methylobacterium brachythecii TaxID=1176177 RepID=A0A7W6AMJ2_9HYPH|nr:AAA family ATPase [Methylobacterium brachythecii]MBB3903959.1 hypothetical protein [Methylobacterium brachythecii]